MSMATLDSNMLFVMSKTHKHVCLNINQFCDLLKGDQSFSHFEPITDRATLLAGLYGLVGMMQVHCSKLMADGMIRFSQEENPGCKNDMVGLMRYRSTNMLRITLICLYWSRDSNAIPNDYL